MIDHTETNDDRRKEPRNTRLSWVTSPEELEFFSPFTLENSFAWYGYSSLLQESEDPAVLRHWAFTFLYRYLLLNNEDVNKPIDERAGLTNDDVTPSEFFSS